MTDEKPKPNLLDRFFLRLPRATRAWSCPWFLTIVALASIGALVSLAFLPNPFAVVALAANVVIIVYTTARRLRAPEGPSC